MIRSSRILFTAATVFLAGTMFAHAARNPQPTATNCGSMLNNIRQSEGSGNYSTNTGNGYYGAYQMGRSALIDVGYMRGDGTWTGKNGINSLEDYLNTPSAQDAAFLEYGNRNLTYLGNYQQYIGQTINGVTVTRGGLIAGSHLVGAGGLKDWLTSGGSCTGRAVDGNGTCAGTYVAENQVNETCSGDEVAAGGGGSCLSAHPVQSPVVFSEYGAWNRPGAGSGNGWHRGSDIYPQGAQGQASTNQPLFAAHDGKLSVGSMGVKVTGSQFRTLYLHSYSRPDPKDVSAGEEIAKIGDNQSAGKPHLHFEVQVPASAVKASKCVPGSSTDDCVFPVGGGKRDPNGYATSDALSSASPNTWYYVNPERFLKERVPVVGMAAVRAGRSQSLPNTCTPGQDVAETPTSSGDSDNSAAMAGGEGTYMTSGGSAAANADKDLRSLAINMTRQNALELRAAASLAQNLEGRTDSALAHMLLLMSRTEIGQQ